VRSLLPIYDELFGIIRAGGITSGINWKFNQKIERNLSKGSTKKINSVLYDMVGVVIDWVIRLIRNIYL
jgi:hypothetical protein